VCECGCCCCYWFSLFCLGRGGGGCFPLACRPHPILGVTLLIGSRPFQGPSRFVAVAIVYLALPTSFFVVASCRRSPEFSAFATVSGSVLSFMNAAHGLPAVMFSPQLASSSFFHRLEAAVRVFRRCAEVGMHRADNVTFWSELAECVKQFVGKASTTEHFRSLANLLTSLSVGPGGCEGVWGVGVCLAWVCCVVRVCAVCMCAVCEYVCECVCACLSL
jgi:hypothetical protein